MPLVDEFSRPLRDLRISVTDRCNFRCTYCMPKERFGPNFAFLPHSELLSFEEITRLVFQFAKLGVTKVRLTGGEPLLRRDLWKLIDMIAKIDGITDIALTTNGSLLTPKLAQTLKDAGLRRITVSLDALDDEVFTRMNDVHFPVAKVLEAIAIASDVGLSPVKVNMVVKRNVNDQSIVTMAEHFRSTPHILRFIEYMDVGNSNGWRMDDVVTAAEILDTIGRRWPLEALAPNRPGEVATRYRYVDGQGEIGVIASVTRAFCGGCTRARLSSEGQLYTCLFAGQGHDLRSLLRSGTSDEEITAVLKQIWHVRSDHYSELRSASTPKLPKVEMSHIGG
ncbi:GTP 3',8-cyclase MoaA [Sulfoacidibacillus thermotolerans]|uniref:GTP 3',8-cyclase n=1 Tax=Sulfoacidibacillus thermotolerans TaxID=1765684 RepID=A0A2U3D6J0_SULT2|nr:GTP 3',8-cyclase MoaA [Sulfoacidibacillus thermotolerans]PWI56884.1 cyclic pyranopterin phosphate synthase [Sulfoacidibacillus thermotolerans]